MAAIGFETPEAATAGFSAYKTDFQDSTAKCVRLSAVPDPLLPQRYTVSLMQWRINSAGAEEESLLDLQVTNAKNAERAIESCRAFGEEVDPAALSEIAMWRALNLIARDLERKTIPDIDAALEQANLKRDPFIKPHIKTSPLFSPPTGRFIFAENLLDCFLGFLKEGQNQQELGRRSKMAFDREHGYIARIRQEVEKKTLSIEVRLEAEFGPLKKEKKESLCAFKLSAAGPGQVEVSQLRFMGVKGKALTPQERLRLFSGIVATLKTVWEGEVPDVVEIAHEANILGKVVSLPPLKPGEDRFTLRVNGGSNLENRVANEAKIGGNSYFYKYEQLTGNAQLKQTRLGIDIGNMMFDRKRYAYDGAIPNLSHNFYHRDDPDHVPEEPYDALLLTHDHDDHDGGIFAMLDQGWILPTIYCSHANKLFLTDKIKNIPLKHRPKMVVIEDGWRQKFGEVTVSAIAMSHSLPDLAYHIETPAGSVFHSGDVKLDQTIKSAKPTNLETITGLKPTLMVADPTSAARPGFTPTESEIAQTSFEAIAKYPGRRIFLTHIASNMSRFPSIAIAAAMNGRDIVVDGRAMERQLFVAKKVGMNPVYQTADGKTQDIVGYIEENFGRAVVDRKSVDAERILTGPHGEQLIVVTGTHDEELSGLHNLARGMHKRYALRPGDVAIVSQTPIPGNEYNYWTPINMMKKLGVEVMTPIDWFHETGAALHASGHAHAEDLREIIARMEPRFGLISHFGGIRQRNSAEAIFEQQGVPVLRAGNQDIIDVRSGKIVGYAPEDWVYWRNKTANFWEQNHQYTSIRVPPHDAIAGVPPLIRAARLALKRNDPLAERARAMHEEIRLKEAYDRQRTHEIEIAAPILGSAFADIPRPRYADDHDHSWLQ